MIPDIIMLIKDKYNLSEDKALARFFKSITYLNYDDDETGLYGQSALHIFSLYMEEQEKRWGLSLRISIKPLHNL